MKRVFLLILSLFLFAALAKEAGGPKLLQRRGLKTLKADQKPQPSSKVIYQVYGNFLFIKGNGIPKHKVGKFNHATISTPIKEQDHSFKISLSPTFAKESTILPMDFIFGVGLNGIPFDPNFSKWYGGDKSSGWQYEALSGVIDLPIDEYLGMVDSQGTYHYKGLSQLLMKRFIMEAEMISPIIGYAADGFPIKAIYDHMGKEMKSSFRLKKGKRSIGGVFDGTFKQDYEFIPKENGLDKCNGKMIEGTYTYFLTKDFPYIPRCWRGIPERSFKKQQAMEGTLSLKEKGAQAKINLTGESKKIDLKSLLKERPRPTKKIEGKSGTGKEGEGKSNGKGIESKSRQQSKLSGDRKTSDKNSSLKNNSKTNKANTKSSAKNSYLPTTQSPYHRQNRGKQNSGKSTPGSIYNMLKGSGTKGPGLSNGLTPLDFLNLLSPPPPPPPSRQSKKACAGKNINDACEYAVPGKDRIEGRCYKLSGGIKACSPY